jgi:hypothetical protein
VTDPRTDRIADLAVHLACEPPAVRVARARADHARRDLQCLLQRGAPAHVLQAYRYRAERAAQDLTDAWRAVIPGARR